MRKPNESDADWQAFFAWYCTTPRPKLQPHQLDLAKRFDWTGRANRLDTAQQASTQAPQELLRRVTAIEARRLLDQVLAQPDGKPLLRPSEIRDLVEFCQTIPPPAKPPQDLIGYTVEELDALLKWSERFNSEKDES
jgi:hypothetical protein